MRITGGQDYAVRVLCGLGWMDGYTLFELWGVDMIY